MQFKEIDPGQPVYMFNTNTIEYCIGKVINRGFPYMGTDRTSNNNRSIMLVDVTIEVDGNKATYAIPENSSITYAGDLSLATEEKLILQEVSRQNEVFSNYIQNYDKYKEKYEKTKELMGKINPAIRQQQENESRFERLEGNIGELKSMFMDFMKEFKK